MTKQQLVRADELRPGDRYQRFANGDRGPQVTVTIVSPKRREWEGWNGDHRARFVEYLEAVGNDKVIPTTFLAEAVLKVER